jgi:hypothetical protein
MLIPPNQRIKEGLRSGEMIVPGNQWPVFLYAGYEYDPENPWKGLFRSTILVCVGSLEVFLAAVADFSGLKAYKHVFMSPSLVEKGPKATWSGNT